MVFAEENGLKKEDSLKQNGVKSNGLKQNGLKSADSKGLSKKSSGDSGEHYIDVTMSAAALESNGFDPTHSTASATTTTSATPDGGGASGGAEKEKKAAGSLSPFTKKLLLVAIPALLIATGLAVGLGVGLSNNGSSSCTTTVNSTTSSSSVNGPYVSDTTVEGMSLDEKVGQLSMVDIRVATSRSRNSLRLGDGASSIIGAPNYAGLFINTPNALPMDVRNWRKLYNQTLNIALNNGAKVAPLFANDQVHGANYVSDATLFPHQVNVAATFNFSLAKLQGQITAKDSACAGIKMAFAPQLDVTLQPRWPRFYENFGEDPYLAAKMGVAMVQGLQGDDPANPLSVAACARTFIGSSNPLSGRDRWPSWTPEQHIYQYFLQVYEEVLAAGALTVMSGYNELDGEMVAASPKYTVDILRGYLNFTGVLFTEWNILRMMAQTNHVAKNYTDAVGLLFRESSTDVVINPHDLGLRDEIRTLINLGVLNETRINLSTKRVLDLKRKLNLIDNPNLPDESCVATVGSDNDKAASLAVARESLVLLRNQNNILPIKNGSRLLVTGPCSDDVASLLGGWSWMPDGSNNFPGITIVQGLRKGNTVLTADSFAPRVDYIVVATGEPPYQELQGDIDSLQLEFPLLGQLQALVNTGKPVILVIVGGRPRVFGPAANGVAAIIWAGLPGPMGGQAVADVITGAVNPSGRLPFTYPSDDVYPYPYYIKRCQVEQCVTYGGNGSCSYTPWFPFGWGLSFSNFTYSDLFANPRSLQAPNGTTEVSVTVTNQGPVDGQTVVMLFVLQEYRRVSPELKRLRGAQKVNLAVGESQTVTFTLGEKDFRYWYRGQWAIDEGRYYAQVDNLQMTFQVFT